MKTNYTFGSLKPYLDLSQATFPIDVQALFGNSHPLEVEIGFGTGEYIAQLGSCDPQGNFLGFEHCPKRTVATLRKLDQLKIHNVRLMMLDAVRGFQYLIPEGSLRRVHCLFPCPWPKKRHAKHRLFQPEVLKLINSRLQKDAALLIVTDHRPYANWILEQLPGTGFVHRQETIGARYGTKFETKWREAGQDAFFALELVKEAHIKVVERIPEDMRVYSVPDFDPEHVVFENELEPSSIQFAEYVYDPKRNYGLVHAIVTEEGRIQHLWVAIIKRQKNWSVAAAHGTNVLQTPGMQRAVELVFNAATKSIQ